MKEISKIFFILIFLFLKISSIEKMKDVKDEKLGQLLVNDFNEPV